MAGDLAEVGKLMDLNQALLNTLLLSTARLEELCAAARHAGAFGAKLTGAGGGGCMIALVGDDETEARVVEALAREGASPFVARVSP
jgi:mevalonate kinase